MADNENPELEYLSPSFDPKSVTVPRLRSILVAHDVSYPSSAKKPQLIELFNEHVAPQARRILNARSRVKRSTRGIIDVPSSQEQASTEADSESDDLPSEPVPLPAKRVSRRTVRSTPSENTVRRSEVGPASSEMPTRNVSIKHGRTSDAELEERPAPRRSRHSTAPLRERLETTEPEAWRKQGDESPFTSDNPFQSGSSPPRQSRSPGGERRRRTMGPLEHKEKRKSNASAARRKTDFVTRQRDDGVVVPSSKTFEMPVARLPQYGHNNGDSLEPGEEFTPEEQQELAKVEQTEGRRDLVAPRRPRRQQRSTGVARIAPWAVSLAMLGGLATVWRQEKLEVGYCGVGRQSTSLAGVELPDWASLLQPQCEPCPQHAYCYGRLETVCEPDFILKPHPLTMGGLIPLPPTCEPDGEKARRVKAVADRAVEELRERNAKWECGELLDESGKQVPSVELDEQELKQEMANKRRKGMSQEEFEDLWKGAIGEILGRDEVVTGVDGFGIIPTESAEAEPSSPPPSPSSPSPVPSEDPSDLRWQDIFGRFRAMEARAKQLASFALDRLATQAALNAQDPRAYPETWISMAQLRDDILRDDFSASRRQKLWEKVQKKVEQNSNIRPMVREGRSGDVSRVWEWIGAVGAIEDGRGGESRRTSSRYSLGPVIGSSPAQLSPIRNGDEQQDLMQTRKWDEGRPIY